MILVSADKMTWPHINFVFKLTNKKQTKKKYGFWKKEASLGLCEKSMVELNCFQTNASS